MNTMEQMLRNERNGTMQVKQMLDRQQRGRTDKEVRTDREKDKLTKTEG